MKLGFWQIQIKEENRYKTTFTIPFGHYEWNMMPFRLKNTLSKFQNMMNYILNPYSYFLIVYIDDILVFSNSIEQHYKHLYTFFNVIKNNSFVVSQRKMKLFQTKVRFLGYDIYQVIITPISRSIEFVNKFPNKIKDKI